MRARQEKINRLIAVVKLKLWGIFFLSAFCSSATFSFVGFGIILTSSHALGSGSPFLSIALSSAALLLPLIYSIAYASRKLPGEKKILALLDKHNPESSGMLLAFEETDGSAWESLITMPEMPLFHIDLSRRLPVLFTAFIFLVCGIFLPDMVPQLKTVHKMDVSKTVKDIKDDIEMLKEEEILSEAETERWKESLDKIAENATGEDPVKTWEAMDHVKQNLQEKAEMCRENTITQLQKLEAIEKTAEALEKNSEQCNPGEFSEAMNEMDKMLKKMLDDDPELKKMLDEACKNGMSSEALKKLAEQCKMSREELKEMLKKLKECGQIKECEIQELSEEDLMKFLKENCDGSGCKKIALCMTTEIPVPGEGGISRGPGAAPMSYHNKDTKFEKNFKNEVLKSGAMDASQSRMVGTSITAPEASNEVKIVSPGQLQSGKFTAGENMTFTIQPRHRQAVREYFDRKQQ